VVVVCIRLIWGHSQEEGRKPFLAMLTNREQFDLQKPAFIAQVYGFPAHPPSKRLQVQLTPPCWHWNCFFGEYLDILRHKPLLVTGYGDVEAFKHGPKRADNLRTDFSPSFVQPLSQPLYRSHSPEAQVGTGNIDLVNVIAALWSPTDTPAHVAVAIDAGAYRDQRSGW